MMEEEQGVDECVGGTGGRRYSKFPSLPSSDKDEGSTEDEGQEEESTWFWMTKKQLSIIVICGIGNLLCCAIISIQAPFYPKEAERKGATATEYGFVFGVFQLTMFIVSPICGILLGQVSPNYVLNEGLFVAGFGTIAFGCLDFVDDHTWFIALSFLLRILQGCGVSAFTGACFTAIAIEFPNSVGTAFAWFESFAGFGLLLGPTVGGLLFDLGGFSLPFIVTGVTVLVFELGVCLFLPSVDNTSNGGDPTKKNSLIDGGFQFITLIKIPAVALAAFSITACSSSIGFLESTLEPHLRANFGLTATQTGGMFVIEGTFYAVFAPLWGRLGDKSKEPKIYFLIGSACTFIGFLLIGPAIFVPMDTFLWVTIVGLMFHGLGTGSTLVSSFISAMKDAVSFGFEDDVVTYGLVSGMLMSAFSLGNFIGPSVGGVLLDHFGFRWASLYVLVTVLMTVIFTCMYLSKSSCCRTRRRSGSKNYISDDEENQSLLPEEPHIYLSPDDLRDPESKLKAKPNYEAT